MAIPEEEYGEVNIEFRDTVAASTGHRRVKSLNYDGKITHVMFHFPPGCEGLVDVRLLKDERPFYPLDGFLALDDSTPIFYMNINYYRKEPLTVEVENRDGVHAHTPSVTVNVRYKKPKWDEK